MTTLEIIAELERCRIMLAEAEAAGDDTGVRDTWAYISELKDELYNVCD